MYGNSSDTEVSEQRMQQIQQVVAQCATDLSTVREQLEGLQAK